MMSQLSEGGGYRDQETLQEDYVEDGLSSREIGEKYGVSKTTILRWLDRFGIEKRTPDQEKLPTPRVNEWGHEYFRTKYDGEYDIFAHHRLIAVAVFGFDEVEDKHVHHVNRIPWDNRHENLKLADPSGHIRHHHQVGDYEHRPRRDDGTYLPRDEWRDAEVNSL